MTRLIDASRSQLPVTGSVLQDVVEELVLLKKTVTPPLPVIASDTLKLPTKDGVHIHACTKQ